MLTLFILLHTADPWLAQQHKAICQAFKCQVWHGDVQYALPAVQLLQELQSGKKKNSLVICKDHSLLQLAEHLPVVYELPFTSRSQQLNKIPENNRR